MNMKIVLNQPKSVSYTLSIYFFGSTICESGQFPESPIRPYNLRIRAIAQNLESNNEADEVSSSREQLEDNILNS